MLRVIVRGGAKLLLGIVAVALLLLALSYVSVGRRIDRVFDVAPAPIAIPTDEQSIARGEHLVTIGRCRACHGRQLGGESWEASSLGQVQAPNLTPGTGGVGATYRDEDWVRAIRHGIGPDGRTLMVTPAQFYYHLSDEDLGAIIAYLKQLPPLDSDPPAEPSLEPLGRVLVSLIDPPYMFPAERIDHDAPRPPVPAAAPTAEYGAYLWNVATCGVCHGDPVELAHRAAESGYNVRLFRRLLRWGALPDGRALGNEIMPWRDTMKMTDDEIDALWAYLEWLQFGAAREARP